jgi:RNA polymerase sigma factor (sigma-70 family)
MAQPVPSHEALMARFQARLDSDAFEQIVSSYMSPALAAARQILPDHALAEDAVQESFLRVIRRRHQYICTSPFSCWFYAIVRNVCVDMLRQRARQKQAIEEIANEGRDGTIGTDLSETPNLLDSLARGERDVLMLRIVHGLRFRDVAAALGISEEAAKKRAQRALRRLRAKTCDLESLPGESCSSADRLPVSL